jgi:DNA-binding NarL/FixJ family response regulator
VTRQIRQDAPGTEVLICSVHDSGSMIRDALEAGARGYVLKHEAKDIVKAVAAVAAHHVYFSSTAAESIRREALQRIPPRAISGRARRGKVALTWPGGTDGAQGA